MQYCEDCSFLQCKKFSCFPANFSFIVSNLIHVTKLLIPMKNLWVENYKAKLISYLILKLIPVSILYFNVLQNFSIWSIIYSIDWPSCLNFSKELYRIIILPLWGKFKLAWFHIAHKIQDLHRCFTCLINIIEQIRRSLLIFSHHCCP